MNLVRRAAAALLCAGGLAVFLPGPPATPWVAGPAAAGPEPGLELPGAAAPGQDSAAVVQARLRPANAQAAPGDTLRLEIDLQIAKGWHLYAHGDTSYYGIELAAAAGARLAPVRVDYPEGKPTVLFGEEARVLSGAVRIPLLAVVAAGAPPGRSQGGLTLTVQACDDRICLAPAAVPLPLRLEIGKARKP